MAPPVLGGVGGGGRKDGGYSNRNHDTDGRVRDGAVAHDEQLTLLFHPAHQTRLRLATPSGLTSIPAGLETPEMIQLRKKKIEEAMEAG